MDEDEVGGLAAMAESVEGWENADDDAAGEGSEESAEGADENAKPAGAKGAEGKPAASDAPAVTLESLQAELSAWKEKESAWEGEKSKLSESAKHFEKMSEQFSRDPASFLKALATQAGIEAQAGGSAAEAKTFEPETEVEADYLEWKGSLQKDLQGFGAGVREQFATQGQYLHDAHMQIAEMGEQLNALAEILEVKFPDLDAKGIEQFLQGNKQISYREAFKQKYSPSVAKTVEMLKQARRARPETPAPTGGAGPKLNPEKFKSLASLAEAVERMG